MDVPGNRRVHRGEIARLGGVSLYIAFVIAIIFAQFLPIERQDPNELTRLIGLLLGSTFIFIFGLYDDKRQFSALPQFAAQFGVSLIAVAFLIFIEIVNNPFTNQQIKFPWFITVPLTVFWLMGMMNTVNWLDGLDGLAGGVVAIAAAIFAIHMYREAQYSVALLPAALLGALVGFLPYNFYPARIFLGSCGAYFLGFALGALSIIAGARVATALLVLGIPILDVAWLILQRSRRGRSPTHAGRDHLHHRLFDLGFSQRQVVLFYYAFCAFFGILALVVPTRIYKLYALGAMGVVTLAILIIVSRLAN